MKTSSPDRQVSEQLRSIADQLEKQLEDVAGQRIGFSLMVFTAEPGARMNYVSNCDRADIVKVLKSLLHSWEQGMPDIEAHKFVS
ncbi:MAG TPA: hypothetical protein ENI80_03440 [Acidiferrobacteraceae bacterium]|nr:hypothetical protein [Acidiferrobacteraceae bacterium]